MFTFCKKISRVFSLTISKMYSVFNPKLIAVAQLCPTSDKVINFSSTEDIAKRAAARGAVMIFFPECTDFVGDSGSHSLEIAEPLSGSLMMKFCNLAKSLNIWLSLGGLHIKEKEDSKIRNTHIIIDNFGNINAKYEKLHLFDVDVDGTGVPLSYESSYVYGGKSLVLPVETPCGRVALSICFDLRFPEMSLLQRRMGAHILTFPSAFTVPTGLAHWHALLRARAIETQCYVVAAAVTGKHKKRSFFGHSLIIDPWGTVIAETSEGCNFAMAEVNLNYLQKVRKEMPIFLQKRNDIYSLTTTYSLSEPSVADYLAIPPDYINYQFGPKLVPGSCMFLKTKHSYASVNKKCFVNGHCLVIADRPVAQFCNLTDVEISDLAQAVWMTMCILSKKYGSNIQIIIQDGPSAGQTIKHVHVHVMPLKMGQKSMVQGYEENPDQNWRELPEMTVEASEYRSITPSRRLSQWLFMDDIPKSLQIKNNDDQKEYKFCNINISKDKLCFVTEKNMVFKFPDESFKEQTIVCPLIQSVYLEEFSPGDIVDHFLSIHKVIQNYENETHNNSYTIFVSNLNDSNHTKFYSNVIPRYEEDLENNDEIYNLLAKQRQILCHK